MKFCVFNANLSTRDPQETTPVSFKLLADSSDGNTNGFQYRSKTSKSGCHESKGLRQSRSGSGVAAARTVLTSALGEHLIVGYDLTMHPYTDGHEDKVIDIKWGEGSIYCPPGDWFHQHFNTGKEPARHLAVRYGSRIHPLGFKVSHQKTDDDVFRSVDEGGWMIPYENEDPEIALRYQAALKANGVVV